jgi:hypothetical protein
MTEDVSRTWADNAASPRGKIVASENEMKIPEKFPPGCKFYSSVGGSDRVVFPDGRVFGTSNEGETL